MKRFDDRQIDSPVQDYLMSDIGQIHHRKQRFELGRDDEKEIVAVMSTTYIVLSTLPTQHCMCHDHSRSD